MDLTPIQRRQLTTLFAQSMKRFEKAKNGTYPYEDYELLFELVAKYRPHSILEAGTGYGLSSIALALGSTRSRIISLDKNHEVLEVARSNAREFGVFDRIGYVQTTFLDYLQNTSDGQFDMVFFDGFAPGLTLFLELERVLKRGGIMICANLQLRGDRRKITQRMNEDKYYSGFGESNGTIWGIKK